MNGSDDIFKFVLPTEIKPAVRDTYCVIKNEILTVSEEGLKWAVDHQKCKRT